jgi:elongation factor P
MSRSFPLGKQNEALQKIHVNEIQVGDVLFLDDDDLWIVEHKEHTQPGKGGAYAQLIIKRFRDGIKGEKRLSTSKSVEKARLEEIEHTFLYSEKIPGHDTSHHFDFVFMHPNTFEEVRVSSDILDENLHPFLTQDLKPISLVMYGDIPIALRLPSKGTFTIQETEVAIKGQTASPSYKHATLNNGVHLMVPPYITEGTLIIVSIDTHTGKAEYFERATIHRN